MSDRIPTLIEAEMAYRRERITTDFRRANARREARAQQVAPTDRRQSWSFLVPGRRRTWLLRTAKHL